MAIQRSFAKVDLDGFQLRGMGPLNQSSEALVRKPRHADVVPVVPILLVVVTGVVQSGQYRRLLVLPMSPIVFDLGRGPRAVRGYHCNAARPQGRHDALPRLNDSVLIKV